MTDWAHGFCWGWLVYHVSTRVGDAAKEWYMRRAKRRREVLDAFAESLVDE